MSPSLLRTIGSCLLGAVATIASAQLDSELVIEPAVVNEPGETLAETAVQASESLPALVTDDTAPTVFLRAGEAYSAGSYGEAAENYRQLVAAGFGTADVHYNLANALLRSGELAQSIAEYRRALFLSPRDQDARANLEFARQSTKDAVAPPAPASWSQTLLFWHHALSFKETVRLLIVVAAVFWFAVALWLLPTGLRSRAPAVLVLVVLVALAGSLLVRTLYPQRIGVVLPAQTDVYSGTDLQSRVIFNLHAGTEVAVTNSDERWTQFAMPDGQRGWLPTEHLVIVSP